MSFLVLFGLFLWKINSDNVTTTYMLTTSAVQTTTFIEPTTTSTPLCPALLAYVAYFANGAEVTALSAAVNWSPFEYLLNETEVIYFADNENVCSISDIVTDVDSKIVLIRDDINLYNCSQQEWTLNLEYWNASGVLLWNQDTGNSINIIDGDNSLPDPDIPTRVIAFGDGQIIKTTIDASKIVSAEFGCFNDSLPVNLCIQDDGPGTTWYIDGEYQRIVGETVNGHPVWFKERYGGAFGPSGYLFIIPDNINGFTWVISPLTFLVDTFSDIQNNTYNADAYCNIKNSTIFDPSLCNDWYIYEYVNSITGIWKKVDYVTVIDGFCDPLDDDLLCINTKNPIETRYESFVGTYRQIHKSQSQWYKVVDPMINDNTSAAVMYWDCFYGVFGECLSRVWRVETIPSRDLIAYCIWGDNDEYIALNDTNNAIGLNPQENCDVWRRLDAERAYVSDLYIGITDGQCSNDTSIDLCPALQSYVEYGFNNDTFTALSARVHYAPYQYELDKTSVLLFPDNENVCNINSIVTDVSNRTVLIKDDINLYNCSQQLWTLNLQNKSALGVLLWNQEILNNIQEIDGNNSLDDPLIPTRVISYDDGLSLFNNINNNPFIIFGCFNDTNPINLCVNDTGTGSTWNIDGEYQRVVNIYVNGHPVWQKQEYGGSWGPSRFIYLVPDNLFGWKWIIAQTTTSVTSFLDIQNNTYNADAYCDITNSSINDPSQCSFWYVYDRLNDTFGTWKEADYVQLINGLCDPLDDELFCLQTNALNPEPYNQMVGLYHQAHITQPEWYKVIDPTINNDTTANAVIFDCLFNTLGNCLYHSWLVVEIPAYLIQAVCIFGTPADWELVADKDAASFRLDECIDWRIFDSNGDFVNDFSLEWNSGICNSMNDNSSTCAASNSYVGYSVSGGTIQVALSTPVHWAPYEYGLSLTSVVLLPDNENVCDINLIVANVSSKVVLIKDDINLYPCSQQLWTLNLQNKGALGVLLWSQDVTNYISFVEGDNSLKNPTIPTRVVSFSDGSIFDVILTNGQSISVTFGCFNDSLPEIFCITDNSPGIAWDVIDGDYEKLTSNRNVNGHPVWAKSLFQGWGTSKYLFLLPDNKNGWKWVISQNTLLVSSFDEIQNGIYNADAYCNILNSSLIDPTLCNDWYIYNINGNWTKFDKISINGNICDPLDSELYCIESNPLDSLSYQDVTGTYFQLHESYPEWYKINALLDNPNVTNSVIIFDCLYNSAGECAFVGWLVIQVPARLIDAFCLFGTADVWNLVVDKSAESLNIEGCNLWYIWVNGQGYVFDQYIDIDKKQCGAPDHDINNGGVFPQTICLTDDNEYAFAQRFYGTWSKTSMIVDERPVYQFDTSNEHYLVHSYISDSYQITKNLASAPYLWEAQCYLVNNPDSPLNCTNGLSLRSLNYISQSINSYFIDWTNTNDNDVCFPKLTQNNIIESDNICITINADFLTSQRLNTSDMSGDYIKQNGLINERDYYFRNGTNQDYYLYYNNFYRFWIIDISINLDYQLIGIDMPIFCIEYNKLNPAQCNEWYTSDVGVQFILLSTGINVRDKACITQSPTLSPTLVTIEPTLITVVPTILTSEPTISTPEPTLITVVPTILTSEPTISTPEPTISTTEPTLITVAPTIITSEPTISTPEPTLSPTLATIEPTIKGSDGGSANINKDNTIKGWVVAVIIIVIIILLAIIVCCLCKRNNQNSSAFGFDHPSSSNANTSIDIGTQINMTSNESKNIDTNATNPTGNDEANTFMETNDSQSPNAGKDGNQWETF